MYLKDEGIISNIAFYEQGKKSEVFGIRDFTIAEDLKSVTCPNGVTTTTFVKMEKTKKASAYLLFSFTRKQCSACPLKDQCLQKNKEGKHKLKFRRLQVPLRYDAALQDLKRNEMSEFTKAYAKRFKIERRFGTMVTNHGLRRSRYMSLARTSVHIIMANMASNIVRMVNLLCGSDMAAAKA
ncbi:MAG: transposase [Eubacteriales bacterium]|nr:transposase [Eubacteriales bacterium]